MIEICQEAEELLGTDVTARVRADAADFVCAFCGVAGDCAHEDASVVVLRTPENIVMQLGHATCGPSQVIDAPSSPTPSHVPDRDLVTQTAVIPVKGKPTAWLFIQPQSGMTIYAPTGDEIDPWLTTLMRHGWELALDVNQKVHPQKSWRLWLDEDGHGQLVDGAGQVWLDRLPQTSPQWRHSANRRGFVHVMIGDINIDELTAQGQASGMNGVRQVLREAITAGTVLQGRVDLAQGRRPGQAAPDSEAATRARLAEELQASLRARAGASDHHFNHLPDIAPLPESTTLELVQIPQGGDAPDLPVALLNLRSHDPAQAAACLDALEGHGFPRNRDLFQSGPWARAPQPWTHVCWPSQLIIMGQDNRGNRAKLIFKAVAGNRDWYTLVRNHPAAAIGVIICNDTSGNPPDADTLERLSGAGDLIAFVVSGMCAS